MTSPYAPRPESAVTGSPHAARLGRATVLAMAASAGAAVANIYYNQPIIGIILAAFPRGRAAATMIPTVTQLGYAAGLLLLVPLADLLERRRLIVAQTLCLCVALAAAARAPGAGSLLAASFAIGMAATIAQQIVPFAAELAAPARRGATVGTVMAGLLLGILLGRTLSGAVAAHGGWRAIFALGAAMMAVDAALLAWQLPISRPPLRGSYAKLLASLAGLALGEKALRRATLVQASLFASFSVFWSILALHLQADFGLGSLVAGSFGLVGAAGVLAAPVAGRLADRGGPRRVVSVGMLVALAAWAIFGLWRSPAGLVAGTVLLDLGIQACLIAHQTLIYAIRPDAKGRLNTVFMTGMFLGGAAGSAAAFLAWRLGGWTAVCGVGFGVPLAGYGLHLAGRRG